MLWAIEECGRQTNVVHSIPLMCCAQMRNWEDTISAANAFIKPFSLHPHGLYLPVLLYIEGEILWRPIHLVLFTHIYIYMPKMRTRTQLYRMLGLTNHKSSSYWTSDHIKKNTMYWTFHAKSSKEIIFYFYIYFHAKNIYTYVLIFVFIFTL